MRKKYFGICPICGASYNCPPALSRDGKIHICLDCGIREALDSVGVPSEEQEMILKTIRDHLQKKQLLI